MAAKRVSRKVRKLRRVETRSKRRTSKQQLRKEIAS